MGTESLIDAREVSKRLGISVTAVHRLAARGTLPSQWLAGRRVWTVDSVKRYEADPDAQRRRRARHLLIQGPLELTLDQVVEKLTEGAHG